jgi:hypothetical protein
MKKVLLLMVAVLMVSSIAMADEHIGVYTDNTGTNCNLGNIAGQFSFGGAHIVERTTTGATGSRFKVTFPPGTTFVGFTTTYVPVGNLTTDLSLGYGTCLFGTFELGTINAIYGAGTGTLEKADLQPKIIYTDCNFGEYEATGGFFYVSTTPGPCEPVIATEPSTWGQVKSLYR